jgi:hypothetical protein
MTREELGTHLATYAAGLEAELSILHQIERLSAAQNRATADHDVDQLHRIADERDRLMSGLVRVESQISPSRQVLFEYRPVAAGMPGFENVAALHRKASDLVTAIMHSDQETMASLREAETARRTASQTLEAGEHTLAAYRRVLSPTSSGPSLVDRKV